MALENIITDVKEILIKLFHDNKGEITDQALEYVADAETRLKLLIEGFVIGEIDQAFFIDRLKEEKDLLLTQALSLKVQGTVLLDEVVQKAIGTLINNFIVIMVRTIV